MSSVGVYKTESSQYIHPSLRISAPEEVNPLWKQVLRSGWSFIDALADDTHVLVVFVRVRGGCLDVPEVAVFLQLAHLIITRSETQWDMRHIDWGELNPPTSIQVGERHYSSVLEVKRNPEGFTAPEGRIQ